MGGGDIVDFHGVMDHVVQLDPSAIAVHQQLPASVADGQGGAYVERMSENPPAILPHQGALSIPGTSHPRPGHVFSVDIRFRRDLDPGQGTDRRQQIHCAHYGGFIEAAGGDAAGPANDEGNPDPAFIQAALPAPEGTGISGAAVGGFAKEDVLGAVVTGEYHDGLTLSAQLPDRFQQPADVVIGIHDIRAVELKRRAEF